MEAVPSQHVAGEELPFYGKMPLEPYMMQVRLETLHNGWNRREAAVHLTLALEGEALQAFDDKQHDIEQLKEALRRSFIWPVCEWAAKARFHERRWKDSETWGKFARNLQKCTQ